MRDDFSVKRANADSAFRCKLKMRTLAATLFAYQKFYVCCEGSFAKLRSQQSTSASATTLPDDAEIAFATHVHRARNSRH
jgi:hypothetical protein